MFGYEIEGVTGADLVRLVGSLGKHRYVASRLHLVHAFVFDAIGAGATPDPGLAEAVGWAARVIGTAGTRVIDLASKDERLYRRVTDAELVLALSAFWERDDPRIRARLVERLAAIGVATEGEPPLPFDETGEEDLFPVLLDVGWELLPLTHLDPERHRGAIQAFDDFEVARFEEESAIPPIVTLHELPLLGRVELLHAFDDGGALRAPFVLWQEGHEAYLDYVLRGVLRAAKLPPVDADG